MIKAEIINIIQQTITRTKIKLKFSNFINELHFYLKDKNSLHNEAIFSETNFMKIYLLLTFIFSKVNNAHVSFFFGFFANTTWTRFFFFKVLVCYPLTEINYNLW